MPTAVQCPTCQHKFTIPEKKAKAECPGCGHRFTAVAAPSADAGSAPAVNPRLGILVSPASGGEGRGTKAPPASDGEGRGSKGPTGKKETSAPPEAPPLSRVPAPPRREPVPLERPAPTAIPVAPAQPPLFPTTPAPAATLSATPVTSSSGRRLTTLVLDAVKAVVGNPTAHVKGITELSLVALTLGLIGLAVTWPFRLGGVGIVLGALGLVMGGVAVGILVKRKAGDYVLPALATLINFQGLIMAIVLACQPEPVKETILAKEDKFPAIADLRAALRSPDAAARVRAIVAVGELADKLETTRADLLTGLRDGEEKVRAAAAEALGHLGPPGRVVYPVLVDVATNDPSEAVREQAERAIKKLDAPTTADLSDLLAVLKDRHAGLRSSAALALGMLGKAANDAAPPLNQALADPDVAVRVSAAQALWQIKGSEAKDIIPVLIAGTHSNTAGPEVRARAAAALGTMRSTDPKILDALEAMLADPDGEVRVKAAFALGEIGAPRTVPKFHDALRDPEAKVRLVAAQALWLRANQTQGVPVLADLLRYRDAGIRANAALALGEIGPPAKEAVPALGLALKDPDALVRTSAADTLYKMGPVAGPAVPALRQALKSLDPGLRASAAFALSGIGAGAREAQPDLVAALTDKNAEVRLFAARALWTIDEKIELIRPVFTQVLKEEKDAKVRAKAAYQLGSLGARADLAVPELLDALYDPDARVREMAATALGKIGGPQARVAFTTLFDRTKEDQPDGVRQAAAEAIRKIGRATKADVKTLIFALEHKNARFRTAAATTLWLMGREAKAAVPALSKALTDAHDAVRHAAPFALAAMGTDAVAAVAALVNALDHADDTLRANAAYALGEIGPKAKEAAPALNGLLNRGKEKLAVRVQAARSLWAIAQQTDNLVPILTLALKDDDAELNVQAAELLTHLAGRANPDDALKRELKAQAVPALIKLVESEEEDPPTGRRLAGIQALGALGFQARDAIPVLLEFLEEEEVQLRAACAEALGKIGAAETQVNKKSVWSKTAYRGLVFFSRVDKSEAVQRAVNGALARIGRPAGDDAETLLALVQDKNHSLFFRTTAAQVLAMIGPEIPKAEIPRLATALDEQPEAGIRAQLAYALGEIGTEARGEHPALVRALKEQDPGLRGAAATALGEIFFDIEAPDAVKAALAEAETSPDENVKAAVAAARKKIK